MDEEACVDKPVPFNFTRVVRTLSSESYTIFEDDEPIGQVDIHFGQGTGYATLILTRVLGEERISELVATIDDQLVSCVLPPYDRLDFVTCVYHGTELDRYGDPSPDEDLGTDNGN